MSSARTRSLMFASRRVRQPDPQPNRLSQVLQRLDDAHAVHMTLDEVPAERISRPERSLQIYTASDVQLTEGGPVERGDDRDEAERFL